MWALFASKSVVPYKAKDRIVLIATKIAKFSVARKTKGGPIWYRLEPFVAA